MINRGQCGPNRRARRHCKTKLQLSMALLLASVVTGPCDGAPTVAEALEGIVAFGRQHAGFRLVEEHEGLFEREFGNLETRVAAEFDSHIHGSFPLLLRPLVLVSCWVHEPLPKNMQIRRLLSSRSCCTGGNPWVTAQKTEPSPTATSATTLSQP